MSETLANIDNIPTETSDNSIARRAVQQTLAEQMRLTSYEIADRKRLLGLGEEHIRALSYCRQTIHDRIDDIVEDFYAIQTKTPEIALVIGDVETLGRLRRAMRGYIMEMFEGIYDEDYVNKRLRVGKVHKRIGVSPKLYTTALRILHNLLDAEVSQVCGDDLARAQTTRQALNTVFMFDMQLIFDTYIGSLVAEVEAGRLELERYAAGLEEQVRERTRQVEEMSRLDMLTQLVNQRGFHEHLRRECGAVERGGTPLSLITIDLNDFKQINDTRGHPEGDQALVAAARVVASSVRDTDIVCRYGGDEFAVILPRTGLDEATTLAHRMIANLEAEDVQGLSFSVGIAVSHPTAPISAADLTKASDRAMYQAKLSYRSDPRSQVVVDASLRQVPTAVAVNVTDNGAAPPLVQANGLSS